MEDKNQTIKIDGREIPFQKGDTIMKAAERAGIDSEIPRFCYHPGLPVAATCRMCTVEVEKAPKLMVACGTPASPGMVVSTRSERVQKSRKGVLEFLLINHPLDCPVCDQAGECDLQDYDYDYGPGNSRFLEKKRMFSSATTKRLSDDITLNMNRCVHCERCVRFTEDVTETHELLMVNRGWKKELTTAGELGMHNDYQGCLADICPVGALTFNDFRFKKRVWFLKKDKSLCDRCSKGCNITVESEHGVVFRYRPVFNEQVNGHWMCDEGRKSYNDLMDKNRVILPLLPSTVQGADSELVPTNWTTLAEHALKFFSGNEKILFILGTDSTNEECDFLMKEIKALTDAEVVFRYHNGTGVMGSSEDQPLDDLLRRSDKTANTKGIEGFGLKPFNPDLDTNFQKSVIFLNGRAIPPSLKTSSSELIWGVWNRDDVDSRKENIFAFIPGLSTVEKSGTYINCDNVTQQFQKAIKPVGHSRSVGEFVQILKEFKNSGVSSENPHQVVGNWKGVE